MALVRLLIARSQRAINYALILTSGLLLIVLCTLLFTQVVYRYVLELPLPWTEELARFALVWFAMLAASLAASRKTHFTFNLGVSYLSAHAKFYLRQGVSALVIAFLIVLYMQSLIYLEVVSGQFATSTGLDMRIPYASVTVGAATMIAIYLLDFLDGVCLCLEGRAGVDIDETNGANTNMRNV